MTKSGWCRTNYHKDGKRRWSNFLTNGLCSECAFTDKVPDKIVRIHEKISDLESERDLLNSEIVACGAERHRLRFKLQTLVKAQLIEL